MKNILFPTEFSSHAPNIFQYVAHLAKAFGAKITLMHAYGLPTSPDESPDLESRGDKNIKKLKAFYEKHGLADMAGVEVSYVAEIGAAGDAILRVAQEEQANLIVIGAQGMTSAKDRFFGGVASRIMKEARCPVLMVPPKSVFKGFNRLVCTTDFNFDDLRVLRAFKKWSEKFSAQVYCLHVLHEEKENIAKLKIGVLKDIFGDKANMHFELKNGELKSTIKEYAVGQEADVVGMLNLKHGFFEDLFGTNLTETVVEELSKPILIFHEL